MFCKLIHMWKDALSPTEVSRGLHSVGHVSVSPQLWESLTPLPELLIIQLTALYCSFWAFYPLKVFTVTVKLVSNIDMNNVSIVNKLLCTVSAVSKAFI